ncbi:Arc/MetJ family transcription regulator [Arthrobacter sp. B2I5]|nr:Arc/MetJ family transcription regulator [Arthrobacter sp. B2I5]
MATTWRRSALPLSLGQRGAYCGMVIFKAVGEGRPYPDHGYSTPKQWASLPPRPVRLDELVTTKRTLDLEALLAEDSTFFGDLFPHVVQYQGTLYLEDGLHRAVRTALHQRTAIHARVLVLDG